jgi:hypothetical protein
VPDAPELARRASCPVSDAETRRRHVAAPGDGPTVRMPLAGRRRAGRSAVRALSPPRCRRPRHRASARERSLWRGRSAGRPLGSPVPPALSSRHPPPRQRRPTTDRDHARQRSTLRALATANGRPAPIRRGTAPPTLAPDASTPNAPPPPRARRVVLIPHRSAPAPPSPRDRAPAASRDAAPRPARLAGTLVAPTVPHGRILADTTSPTAADRPRCPASMLGASPPHHATHAPRRLPSSPGSRRPFPRHRVPTTILTLSSQVSRLRHLCRPGPRDAPRPPAADFRHHLHAAWRPPDFHRRAAPSPPRRMPREPPRLA